jgi:hypothetical protein
LHCHLWVGRRTAWHADTPSSEGCFRDGQAHIVRKGSPGVLLPAIRRGPRVPGPRGFGTTAPATLTKYREIGRVPRSRPACDATACRHRPVGAAEQCLAAWFSFDRDYLFLSLVGRSLSVTDEATWSLRIPYIFWFKAPSESNFRRSASISHCSLTDVVVLPLITSIFFRSKVRDLRATHVPQRPPNAKGSRRRSER